MLPAKNILNNINATFNVQGLYKSGRRGACSDFELNAAECLEAYGLIRGYDMCRYYVQDFKECQSHTLSSFRSYRMKIEQAKKSLKGDKTAHPEHPMYYHSYVEGSFLP